VELRVLSPAAKRHRRSASQGQNRMDSRVERLGTGLLKVGTSVNVREKFKRRWTLTVHGVARLNGCFLLGTFLPGAPCDVRGAALFENTFAKIPPKIEASEPSISKGRLPQSEFSRTSASVRCCSNHVTV
jgi:hypothetical protein